MSRPLHRRHFLLSAGAVGVGWGLTHSAPKKIAPSERLRIGAIGIAGQSGSDLDAIAEAGLWDDRR